MNKNSIEYWYPKIKDIVPTPFTKIFPLKWEMIVDGSFKISQEDIQEIREGLLSFKLPVFIRGRGKDGKWWCIDCALGIYSWHPEDCKVLQKLKSITEIRVKKEKQDEI